MNLGVVYFVCHHGTYRGTNVLTEAEEMGCVRVLISVTVTSSVVHKTSAQQTSRYTEDTADACPVEWDGRRGSTCTSSLHNAPFIDVGPQECYNEIDNEVSTIT